MVRTINTSSLDSTTINNNTIQLIRPTYILVQGPPGSGVSTLADKIKKEFHYELLDIEELFRAEVLLQTELGKKIDTSIKDKRVIDVTTIIELLTININRTNNDKFLIINFPKNKTHLLNLEKSFGMPSFILEVQCDKQVYCL